MCNQEKLKMCKFPFMPDDSGSMGIQAQLLALCDGHVLVRKVKIFEPPILNTF